MQDPIAPPSLLQFDTAEGVAPGAVSCTLCSRSLPDEYHELNGLTVCEFCRASAEGARVRDSQWSQFIVAAAYGFGAAVLGWLAYWLFVKLTGINFGLVAIAVGWLVGKAVMKGSNGRGGRRYQWLALVLTYVAVSMAFGALVFEEFMKKGQDKVDEVVKEAGKNSAPKGSKPAVPSPDAPGSSSTPAASSTPAEPKLEIKPLPKGAAKEEPVSIGGAILGLGLLFLFLLASPFLAGFSNFIGWLIIAFGLMEAWKHTREVPFLTGGPYKIQKPEPEPVRPPPMPNEDEGESEEPASA